MDDANNTVWRFYDKPLAVMTLCNDSRFLHFFQDWCLSRALKESLHGPLATGDAVKLPDGSEPPHG